MTRNAAVLFLAGAITLTSLMAMAGSSRISGPIVVTFTGTSHGLHRTDFVVAVVWAVSMLVCWRLRRVD